MSNEIQALQFLIGAEQDGIFGPDTAVRYAAARARGDWLDERIVKKVRALVAALVPYWTRAEEVYGPHESEVMDDPYHRGACVLRSDCTWGDNLRSAALPGGWHVTLHRRVLPYAICAFADIQASGYGAAIRRVDSYCLRRILWTPGKPLSNHARGIALDINPAENAYGTYGALPAEVGQCFQAWGWNWGRFWTPDSQRDPMHMELCAR